ncbi:lysozyme inhibitor LprI family protein [Caballeronia sp. NCTM1]|uniref:lysozyme inhibitor LprI family protein n=1 Tax=Caballeronia sp. NCTM1 TaxID=2921753 RepID=UPI002027E5E2|nr:lysozyme inhibitor LprI family protein [Caballeronia sp. NCTM1]
MAGRKLSDVARDAIDARSRLTVNRWEVMEGDVQRRIFELSTLLKTSREPEVNRHIVVSVIAALQTYVRGTVISLCDLGSDYRTRAAGLIPEKFSLKDALEWTGGSGATFGELVAHTASCSSITDIFHWLDGLLGRSLARALHGIISPYDQRNKVPGASPVIPDVNAAIATISRAFELRNILAHEAAATLRIRRSACLEIVNAVRDFIFGVDAVLWATAYAHLPLTQFEMNVHAGEELGRARRDLEAALQDARDISPAETRRWLMANQAEWQRVLDDWHDHTYRTLDGTIWPAVGAAELTKVVRSRRDQIAAWVLAINPETTLPKAVPDKFLDWLSDEGEDETNSPDVLPDSGASPTWKP